MVGPRLAGETRDEYITRLSGEAKRHSGYLQDATLLVAPPVLPNLYPESWRYRNGLVEIDLPLARAEAMALIRAERGLRIGLTDAGMMRLLEQAPSSVEAVALKDRRQALRDLPATAQTDLDTKLTAQDIAAYVPVWP